MYREGFKQEVFENTTSDSPPGELAMSRKTSILDVMDDTFGPQGCDHSEDSDQQQEVSEDDFPEEVDIGDMAFDIAFNAVDDITKIKQRLGDKIFVFTRFGYRPI